jgi:hypothetical protein
MQFQVPQFIEVEDKIFGPFTFKQFIYLVGGGGAVYILWSLFPVYISIILIIPIATLALALAFYKVNGRPFMQALEAGVAYYLKGKLYIWRKEVPGKGKEVPSTESRVPSVAPEITVPKLTEGKLKDIAWSLDIKEKIEK